MFKLFSFAGPLLVCTSLTAPAQSANAGAASTVQVHLTYTGSGTVDSSHKIYIAVWDTPNFVTDSTGMPVATGSMTSKDGTVTIGGVKANPAYVSAAYDPTGTWDAQSAPPAGTIVGMYGTAGKPDPIETKPGKTTKVRMMLDDSVKLPPPNK